MHAEKIITSDLNLKIADKITTKNILDLIDNYISAIHVVDFYPKNIARKVASSAINSAMLDYYKIQNKIGRIGLPHIDIEDNNEALNQYHLDAVDTMHKIREMFFPNISPIDYLRLLLQEIWPAGSNLQHVNGRTCFAGAFRIFDPEAELMPHYDRLEHHVNTYNAEELQHTIGQLAVNIYLAVPEIGGELDLWLREPNAEEGKKIRKYDGVSKESLEPPRLSIKPGIGDLIMFNSRMIHTVKPGESTHRVGMTSFISCSGISKPLTFFS